jgi:hypothetical protein
MRKSLLTTVAGAVLIAGGGLAVAQQRMESTPGGTNGVRGSSQTEPGGAAHERQPGSMRGPAQKRSGAAEEQERRSEQFGEMQGQTQKRSGTVEEKERRSGQAGEMQGRAQKRSGTVEEKERRSGQPGAMQGQAQGRSGAVEDRSGQSGAVQGSAQGGPERSVGSTPLSPDQRTKLRESIVSGNVHRVDHVDFSLSVGVRVPGTARIYDVPERIVDIVPQYRGFKYIAVNDELAIIDPGTREVVALLPTHGSAHERSGRSVGSATLSPDQKTKLHGLITVRRIDDVDFALSVGTRVPDTVTFYDVPEPIVDILPQYRGFEYIVVKDELVIIDPDTLEIVAVLPA